MVEVAATVLLALVTPAATSAAVLTLVTPIPKVPAPAEVRTAAAPPNVDVPLVAVANALNAVRIACASSTATPEATIEKLPAVPPTVVKS